MPYVSGGSVLNIMKYAYPEVRRALGELAGRVASFSCSIVKNKIGPFCVSNSGPLGA